MFSSHGVSLRKCMCDRERFSTIFSSIGSLIQSLEEFSEYACLPYIEQSQINLAKLCIPCDLNK